MSIHLSPSTQAALQQLQEQPPTSDQRRTVPADVDRALVAAECALADIAEGAAEEGEGDPLSWAEKRAADALAVIRPVMRRHEVRTSEWPPLPGRVQL